MRCPKCGQYKKAKHKCPNRLYGMALEWKKKRYKLSKKSRIPTPQLGYILGVILGDGWITKKTIYLRVIDKDFASAFARACFEQFKKEPHEYERIYENKHKIKGKSIKRPTHFFEIAFCSTEVSKFIKDEIEKVYRNLSKYPIEFKKELLKGIFDSDGCYIKGKRHISLKLAIFDKRTIKLCTKILESIGIPKDKIYVYGGNLVLYGKNADMFMKNVGTSIQRKMDKFISPLERKDGSAEATTNITVGSGETVTTLSIKVQAGADGCLGNPEIPNSFAVCFNVSNTALWDEIRPDNYVSKIPAPAYLDQYNILDDTCYVIGDAICDYDSYKFDVVLDAAASQNPGITDYMYVFVLDKTYYIGDDQKWTQGWGMDSDLVTDTDIGVTSLGNEKAVWFA